MRTYARIDGNCVAEIFITDGDVTTMFVPELIWVDVTDISPTPKQGWLAAEASGLWSFLPPPTPPAPTVDQVKASLCAAIDSAADRVYVEIGGPSPGRLAEYKQAKADADSFKQAGYSGSVPDTIACWAEAQGWSAKQACDDILATADAWDGALEAIRRGRLIGKANVNSCADASAANAAAEQVIANIRAVPAGL